MASYIPPPLSVDNVTLQQSGVGTISVKNAGVGLTQLAEAAKTQHFEGAHPLLAAVTTEFTSLNGGSGMSTTEADVAAPMAKPGTFKQVKVKLGGTLSGSTYTWTLRKNAADQLLTLAFSDADGANPEKTATIDVTNVADDDLCIEHTTAGAAGAGKNPSWDLTWVPSG